MTTICETLIADVELQEHLRKGGDVADDVGQELVSRVVNSAMKFPHVCDPTQKLGFTEGDLSQVYTEMIERLMPEPVIIWNVSFDVLAPTPLFIDPRAFESLLADLTKHTSEKAGEERRTAIKEFSVAYITESYANATHIRLKHGCLRAGFFVACSMVFVWVVSDVLFA